MATEEPQNLDISVPPEQLTGVYANLAVVTTQSPHDVTLDFIQVGPGSPVSAVVVARLKLAPSFLMPLMQALSNHLHQHEQLQRQAESGGPEPLPPPQEEPS